MTVPSSSCSFFRLFSRNARSLSLSLLAAATAQPTASGCRVGVVPVSRGAEKRERERGEGEGEGEGRRESGRAGNKWQFRCAQADGGVAGPLCRLTVLTPAARRHHKPHRSAASTQVFNPSQSAGHDLSTPPRAQTTSSSQQSVERARGGGSRCAELHLHLAGHGARHGGLWIWAHGGVPSRWRRPQPRGPRVVRPAGAPFRRRVLPLRRARGGRTAAMAAARAAAAAAAAPVLHLQHHPLLR